MSTLEISRNQKQELESFIAFINELVESLKSSKKAVQEFVADCKFCIQLRKQRKTFTKHMKTSKQLFPKLSESKQVDLEMFYFKGVKELKSMLPGIENEIKNDLIFPLNHFLLRELRITIELISNVQAYMSETLYPDNSQKILNDPKLMSKMTEQWADCDDY